jgi:hypothetical protein
MLPLYFGAIWWWLPGISHAAYSTLSSWHGAFALWYFNVAWWWGTKEKYKGSGGFIHPH